MQQATLQTVNNARAIAHFISTHQRRPSRRAPESAAEEIRLAFAMSAIRRAHPALAEEYGFSGDRLLAARRPTWNKPLQRTLTSAGEIAAFKAEHGRLPQVNVANDMEHSLGQRMQNIRLRHPDVAARYGFAPEVKPAAPKPVATSTPRPRGTPVWTFARHLISVARDGGVQKASKLHETMPVEPLACQATSHARMRAEIEADCWWFTLAGHDTPDPRPWRELRASGDCVLITSATRVAFLDFEAWGKPSGLKKAPRRVW